MTSTLTPWLQDAMDLWPIFAAVFGIIGGWLAWSFKTWVRQTIAEPIARLAEKVEHVAHIVEYHLGPNDGTKPVHKRLIALEKAHDIEGDEE